MALVPGPDERLNVTSPILRGMVSVLKLRSHVRAALISSSFDDGGSEALAKGRTLGRVRFTIRTEAGTSQPDLSMSLVWCFLIDLWSLLIIASLKMSKEDPRVRDEMGTRGTPSSTQWKIVFSFESA